ncbi:MAG TPA: hypothetical protein VN625_09055 [Desulfuromonadaceae bacterium]|nr:hypothetical protein [Desulfuromonadaceae bacterium]
MNRLLTVLVLGCLTSFVAPAAELQSWDFTVDKVARTALVYAPASAKTTNAPVVFVFHGHGGSAKQASISFAMHEQWPQAIVIYMQGLDTPGQLTDPKGVRPGWQPLEGDEGDRDLKFFDVVLARVNKEYKVDGKRIYSTGHSNGGSFTYLLWLTRPDVFAAMAPSAAAATYARRLKPKPAFICGGEEDPLVKPEWQRLTIGLVRRVDSCPQTGQSWENEIGCTLYPSEKGTPVVVFTYPGGHELNPKSPALIAKFFQEHSK